MDPFRAWQIVDIAVLETMASGDDAVPKLKEYQVHYPS